MTPQFPLDNQDNESNGLDTLSLPSVAPADSFAHMVEQGWDAGGEEDLESMPNFLTYGVADTGDDLFGVGPLAIQDGIFDPSDVEGTHLDLPFEEASIQDQSLQDDEWQLVGEASDQFGKDAESVLGINISACVDVAYSMLPVLPPKPIWEQGVWADIFGDGQFLRSSWTTAGLSRPPFVSLQSNHFEPPAEIERKSKARKIISDCSYADIVVHKTDQTWQEERESLLQNALKRWLVVCSSFNAKTTIRIQLDCAVGELEKLNILADVFRGRAPSTLLKRVRSLEKLCHHFGIGNFPPSEPDIYNFLSLQRSVGAPPSRLRSFLEGLNFCVHVLSMHELKSAVGSRRCIGTTSADVPASIAQASPLTVEELKTLHKCLQDGEAWDRVFSGSILFATYARARWADLMHTDELVIDRDEDQSVAFLEAHTSTHKTMRSQVFRHRFLPLTAHGTGVTFENWAEAWLNCRKAIGIQLPPKNVIMPAPDDCGAPCIRPLSSTEASQWLRKILTGCKDVMSDRKVSIHSCKATCLSFCAKYGIDALTRLQLGYHCGNDTGLRMVHTYSRDSMAEPLAKLGKVLADIRALRFKPDCTRSGRFDKGVECSPEPVPRPMQLSRVVEGSGGHSLETVDLVSEKAESEASDVEASSSSASSSEEEFQEEQKSARVFLPPSPPPGFIFWQHLKMKTLHLAPPENRRVFICNRPIGPNHVNSGMSIRYDTPVCRMCLHASKQ